MHRGKDQALQDCLDSLLPKALIAIHNTFVLIGIGDHQRELAFSLPYPCHPCYPWFLRT